MKKFVACLLMIILVFSSFLTSVVATTTTTVENKKPNKNDNSIYFKVPTTGENPWGDSEIVYCHIWEAGGNEFFSWQAKSEKCQRFSDDVWYYDLDILENSLYLEGGIKPGRVYAIIFSDDHGNQTYDLYFNTDCIGDIVVCTGQTQKNPVNLRQLCSIAEWKNNSEFDSVVYDKESGTSSSSSLSVASDDSADQNLSKEMSFAVVVIVSSVVLLLVIAYVVSSIVKKRKGIE